MAAREVTAPIAELRAQLMSDGFLVLKQVVPPSWLGRLRDEYEALVTVQRRLWDAQHRPGEPEGGGTPWETSPQPRLLLSSPPLSEHIGPATVGAIEFWCHPNMHGLSSQLLGVEDAAVNEMMLMCNPQRDHDGERDWNGWHRDVYPTRCAPLGSYTADIHEGGPRYLQWNVSLYDDDVLRVVPRSHLRPATEAEDRIMRRESQDPYGVTHCHVPLPGEVVADLKAGDGVVYVSPTILHWGSSYTSKLRRCIHGGYSVGMTSSTGMMGPFLPHLSDASRALFIGWRDRCGLLGASSEPYDAPPPRPAVCSSKHIHVLVDCMY
eukprot:SAG22_NODE_450_length_10398_cov_8.760171_2_plen_322_part_00